MYVSCFLCRYLFQVRAEHIGCCSPHSRNCARATCLLCKILLLHCYSLCNAFLFLVRYYRSNYRHLENNLFRGKLQFGKREESSKGQRGRAGAVRVHLTWDLSPAVNLSDPRFELRRQRSFTRREAVQNRDFPMLEQHLGPLRRSVG